MAAKRGWLDESSYSRKSPPSGHVDWFAHGAPRRSYPEDGVIKLSAMSNPATSRLEDCLRERRSVRSYASRQMDAAHAAYLLWAQCGLVGPGGTKRTAPSAGGIYPLEAYLISNNISGIPAGSYHYDPAGHLLQRVHAGPLAAEAEAAAMGQDICSRAQSVVVWTADIGRAAAKYGSRALRYVFLDAGHAAQNLMLAAASVRLGSCPVGAFYDDEANALVGADGESETVVYMMSAGIPA